MCNENLDGQRANIPEVYGETEVSPMFNAVSYTHLDVYKRQSTDTVHE